MGIGKRRKRCALSAIPPIFVGVDGSPRTRAALRWAAADAVRHRAPLRLVCAIGAPGDSGRSIEPGQCNVDDCQQGGLDALEIACTAVVDPVRLLAEGPDRSIGPILNQRIAVNGTATGMAGAGGYLAVRLTGTLGRARTVTLLSIVDAQLGETAVLRPTDPVVLGAAVVSAAALFGIVETPGLSRLFGCRPVGPGGLLIAGTAAAAGTIATLLLPPADNDRLRRLIGGRRAEARDPAMPAVGPNVTGAGDLVTSPGRPDVDKDFSHSSGSFGHRQQPAAGIGTR